MIARTASFLAGAILLSTGLFAQPTIFPGPFLTLVDGATGKPLPGAEVTFVELSALTEDDDYDVLFERYGDRRRCDEAGRVRFPSHVGHWLVEGRHGRLWNRSTYRLEREPVCKIALHPDDDPGPLVVQVVDAGGRPVAGVPVDMPQFWSAGDPVRPVAVTRGSQGIARFRLTRESLASTLHGSSLSVQLGLFGLEPVHRHVESLDDPVRITLPECGRVTVNVRLSDGTPVPTFAGLRFLALEYPLCWQVRKVRDGKITFPFVKRGVWVPLVEDGTDGFHLLPDGEAQVPCSRAAGTENTTTLTVKATRPLVHGSVIMPDGRAASYPYRVMFQRELASGKADDRNVAWWLRHAPYPCHFAVDGTGRFCLALRNDACYRRLRVRAVRSGQVWAYGSIPLEGSYPRGLHDLGTIQLKPSRFIVAGTVVDQRGRSLRASVAVHPKPADGGGGWWRQEGRWRALYRHAIGYWRMMKTRCIHGEFTIRTDREGRFGIWGEPTDGPVDLMVKAEGLAPTIFKKVAPGSTGLKLVPDGFGAIKGMVPFPVGEFPERFVVSAELDGREVAETRIQSDRSFLLRDVRPGELTLCIRPRHRLGSKPLLEIPGVQVTPGRTTSIRIPPEQLEAALERFRGDEEQAGTLATS